MSDNEDVEWFANSEPERIVLDQERWDAFAALLDEPPKPNPKLRALFRRPSRIVREDD